MANVASQVGLADVSEGALGSPRQPNLEATYGMANVASQVGLAEAEGELEGSPPPKLI